MTNPTATPARPSASDRYLAPGWLTRNVMNRLVRRLTRMGISLWGSRELRIVGRTSGQVRTNVVNLLEIDGERYLVSPRGATQWVRNLRAARRGELQVGRRVEAFGAHEVADGAKVAILRTYLERWGWEVGQFFEGIDRDATDAELARIAPDFPVFALTQGPA